MLGVALACACAGGACAIDIPDVVTDGSAPDATTDAGADVPLPTCGPGACGAPAGFSPVLFAANRNNACPAQLTTSDVLSDPVPEAKACKCDCAVTQPPSCLPQPLAHLVDGDGGTCSVSGTTFVADGGCNTQGYTTLSPHWQAGPFAPAAPGACTSSATPDTSKVQSTAARLCVDPSCATCAAPAGFQICYAAPGVVACPSGMTSHQVGTDVTVSCGACSACSVTGACEGEVDFFSDLGCKTQVGAAEIDGGCNGTGASGFTLVRSFRYIPTLTSSCNAGTASPTGASLTAPTTLCCP